MLEERRRDRRLQQCGEGDWGKWERKAPKWLLSDAKTEEPFRGDEDRDFLRVSR